MLAAIVLIWKGKGLAGLRELGSRIVWLGKGLFWLVAITLPALCLVFGYMRDPNPEVFTASILGGKFLLDLVFFGFGEEI